MDYGVPLGFKGTDRFLLRVDDPTCDLDCDIVFRLLEVRVDLSGDRPVLRFQRVIHTDLSGGENLVFTFRDAAGNRVVPSVSQAPTLGEIGVSPDAVTYTPTAGSYHAYGGDPDTFGLSFPGDGGQTGEASFDLALASVTPQFSIPKNMPYRFGRTFFLQKFFSASREDVPKIKFDRLPFRGALFLNDEGINTDMAVAGADLGNIFYKPDAGVSGIDYFSVSGWIGDAWTNARYVFFQISDIGGGDINGDGKTDLLDVILCLKILAAAYPELADLSLADINKDGRITLAEVIFILQMVAELR